ncbi:DUF732 domain-containing protein [Mycolicibacterium sp.]|uniref:DUF732 domain-containing protein n=1 Tax=Mycolicibacterium sp. TaxID=2320850 RepID=UPI003D106568
MISRYVRRSAVGAAAAISTAVLSGALTAGVPSAHATEADDQFLSLVADLGLEFATPDAAIEAGNNVCDIVAEGSANNVAPAEIRGSIINALLAEGLAAPAAAQLMTGAVNAFCPEYTAVVSG